MSSSPVATIICNISHTGSNKYCFLTREMQDKFSGSHGTNPFDSYDDTKWSITHRYLTNSLGDNIHSQLVFTGTNFSSLELSSSTTTLDLQKFIVDCIEIGPDTWMEGDIELYGHEIEYEAVFFRLSDAKLNILWEKGGGSSFDYAQPLLPSKSKPPSIQSIATLVASNQPVFLNVPTDNEDQKEVAKAEGAKWSKDEGLYYATGEDLNALIPMFDVIDLAKKVTLSIPFEEKEAAKAAFPFMRYHWGTRSWWVAEQDVSRLNGRYVSLSPSPKKSKTKSSEGATKSKPEVIDLLSDTEEDFEITTTTTKVTIKKTGGGAETTTTTTTTKRKRKGPPINASAASLPLPLPPSPSPVKKKKKK